MNRRVEIFLATLLLLLAAILRAGDLSRLPPGFTDDELAYIRLTEAVRSGSVAVYYQVGDEHGRAGMYAVANSVVTEALGGGLFGYRLLPLGANLLALALLYALARRLFGPVVALIALGAMSVNLRAVLLARTATAEALVPFYVLLTFFVLALAFHLGREIRFRAPSTLAFVVLAGLFGASGYLHYTTLVVGPIGALFFVHLLLTRQPVSRRIWNVVLFVLVLATVVALPYLASTVREPSASEPYLLVTERPRSAADLVDGILGAVGGIIWQGDERVAYNLPDLALLGPAMSVLLVIGLARAVRRWREPRYALLLLSLLAGVATDVWVGREPTFSANLVALPALYTLPGIGAVILWRALRVRSRDRSRAWQPVAALLVVMLVANTALTWHRVYAQWDERDGIDEVYHADLGRVAAYLDRTADGPPAVICTTALREQNAVGLTPRQVLRLMMVHQDVPLRHADCRGGLIFVNAGNTMRYIFVNPTSRDLMPPELSEWLADAQPLDADVLPAGSAWQLNVEQRIEDLGGYWLMSAHTFFLPDVIGGGSVPAMLPVTLERNLTFAGYDPRGLSARAAGGDPIVLATYWRVDGPLPRDLGIFTHLLAYLNPRLQPLAESNTISVIPSELENRDIFVQISYLWLSDRLRPGDYPLTVGAYTGEVAMLENHLRVIDRAGNSALRGERLLLGDVEVLPANQQAATQ